MPKVTGRSMWSAEVELEIEKLALSVQYVEKGKGSNKKRYLVATDWLDQDKKTVLLDIGKRLKGWFKEQVATMKSSWKDRVQYGLVAKSLPNAGYIPVATIEGFEPSRNWESFKQVDLYEMNGLPEPNVETIMTEKGTSVFALHYVLENPITVKALIYSFAYGLRPDNIEEWMRVLGKVKGLGDLHNASAGYGCFTVKSFKLLEEKELSF